MFQILPCSECKKETILPSGVSLEATVQCPHCGKKFVVGEMLTAQFQSWEVISDPLNSPILNPHRPVHQDIDDAEEDSNAELKLQDEDESHSRPKTKVNTDWKSFEPITHEQFERMRRKSRSPMWSIVQVVLGGLAAIPIGLLLVWHLVGTDVGGAGPFIGQYVPWIVPEKFRPYEEDADESVAAKTEPTPPKAGESGFRNFDDVMPPDDPNSNMEEGAEEYADYEAMKGAAEGSSRRTGAIAGLSRPDFSESEPGMQAKIPPDAGAKAAGGRRLSAGPGPTAPSDPDATEAAGDPVAQNIFAAIRGCKSNIDLWRGIDPEDKDELRPLAKSLYAKLQNLAVRIEALPKGNPVLRHIRSQMQPIGRSIKQEESLQSLIEQGAKFWFTKSKESSREAELDAIDAINEEPSYPTPQGLAIIAEIAKAEKIDGTWHLKLSSDTQLPATTVRVPGYLAPSLIAGQRLLLLGTITHPDSYPADPAGTGEDPADEDSAGEDSAGGDSAPNEQDGDKSAPQNSLFVANYLHSL